MRRPTAPSTPSSSTDLKSRDGSLVSSHISFELPPPAITFDSRSSSTSTAFFSSSYRPHSPISDPQPVQAAKSRATAARKRTTTSASSSKGAEMFDLPPPPTRTRKIIQMKPSTAPANEPSPDEQLSKAALSKRKPPSATSAAGRKMARKTAHSLIERRRRSKMNEEFGVLKDMIPACKGEMHKLAIIQASIEYVRYLEDCIAQLKSQNGYNTPTIASRRDSSSNTPLHPYATSSNTSDASYTDIEMTAPPPAFSPSHQSTQHQHQEQPSTSTPPRPEDLQHTCNFSHSSSTSPAFGPRTYTWHGSATSSALTSPALGPMAEEETATVALMMLNGDWRMGEQEREGGKVVGRGTQRARGMSVRDLLST